MSKRLLSIPYILWAITFILVPLGIVIYYGLSNRAGTFTMENITAIASPLHMKALLLSLLLSLIASFICFILAYPLAMILSNMKDVSNGIMVLIFILPMWMNFLLRTLAWQTLLEKNGVINNILNILQLPKLNIINTPTAIVLGMVYNFLPFMVLPIYNSLIKIDPNVINAARDLGANSFQTFIRIIFPQTISGIISGFTMVFIPALTTFVISNILGGSKILLIGNVIEQEFMQASNKHLGSGLSVVLMFFILISIIVFIISEREDGGGLL